MRSTWARDMYFKWAPDALQGAILVIRRSPEWKREGIVFIHVPKAAGTSFSNALYGGFLGHVRASDIEKWAPAGVRSLPSFAITRNPWDRLVSAYRYGRRLHTRDWQSDKSVPESVRRQVPEHDSFRSFVTDWLQHRDVTRLNQIYIPQYIYICDADGRPIPNHVGRVEDLGPTYEFIAKHHAPIPPIDETNRSGEPVDYRSFYTPDLVDIVGRLYALDVEIFGYSFDGA